MHHKRCGQQVQPEGIVAEIAATPRIPDVVEQRQRKHRQTREPEPPGKLLEGNIGQQEAGNHQGGNHRQQAEGHAMAQVEQTAGEGDQRRLLQRGQIEGAEAVADEGQHHQQQRNARQGQSAYPHQPLRQQREACYGNQIFDAEPICPGQPSSGQHDADGDENVAEAAYEAQRFLGAKIGCLVPQAFLRAIVQLVYDLQYLPVRQFVHYSDSAHPTCRLGILSLLEGCRLR